MNFRNRKTNERKRPTTRGKIGPFHEKQKKGKRHVYDTKNRKWATISINKRSESEDGWRQKYRGGLRKGPSTQQHSVKRRTWEGWKVCEVFRKSECRESPMVEAI